MLVLRTTQNTNAIRCKIKISLTLRLFVHLVSNKLEQVKVELPYCSSCKSVFLRLCVNKAKKLPLHFLDTSVIGLFKNSAETGKPGREGKLSSAGRVCARFVGTLKLTTLK